VAFGMGAFDGKLHAEENAIRAIREDLVHRGIRSGQHGPAGWSVTVVVDQVVCDERCRPTLRQFADDYGIARDRVLAYYPERVGGDTKVTPKTASKTAHVEPTRISSQGEPVIATGDHPHRLEAPPPPKAPKTPPRGPKTPPKGPGKPPTREKVGTETPSSGPKPRLSKAVTAELEVASKELSTFRRTAGTIAKGLGAVLRLGVVPVQLALEILNAVSAIEMTESALRGDGWVLSAQVVEARDLAKDSTEMMGAYNQGRYHEDLERLVDTALKNDEHFAELGVNADYWGSLELSDFCVQAVAQLSPHVDQCQTISDHLSSMTEWVKSAKKFCNDEINSDALLVAEAAGGATGIPAGITETLYEALLDLDKIAGYLGGPTAAMQEHLTRAKGDLQLLNDNILTQGFADVQSGG
jgi:hypothetical protein